MRQPNGVYALNAEGDIPSNPAVVVASLKIGYDGGERCCDDSLTVSSSVTLHGTKPLTHLIQHSEEHRQHQSKADNT